MRGASLPTALPTERSKPSLSPDTMKVLLYGPEKIGKTTLAANFNPEHTLFLATEPGHDALSVFKIDLTSWEQYREVGKQLAAGDHEFKTVVIDTVDNLAKLCQDKITSDLGITHPSDLEWGKGWDAFGTEFKLRISALAALGLGIWFVSHSRTDEVKQRVGSISVTQPSLSGSSRKFISGFVDAIFYVESVQGESGEQRLIRTAAAENHSAGVRGTQDLSIKLPDPLPLDAPTLRSELDTYCAAIRGEITQAKEEK